MSELSEFQQRAVVVTLVKMFTGKHFSICDLETLSDTLGRRSSLGGKDYSALRGLHCVDWGDMGPDLALMVRQKCAEMLGLVPDGVETAYQNYRRSTSPPAQKAAGLLSFLGWKQ